jgi:hypothetical protein
MERMTDDDYDSLPRSLIKPFTYLIGLSLREHSKPDRFRSTTGGISNGGDQAKYIKDLKNLYFNGEQF